MIHKTTPAQTNQNLASQAADQRPMMPTPAAIVQLLSKRVIGQDQAKQTLATAVYQHFLNCAHSDLFGGSVEPENHVMLIGNSGCGKSLLFRTLRDALQIPIFHITCTNITPDGYKGKNFAQHLDSIADILVNNNRTSPAIVVWDEFDKLAVNSLHTHNPSASDSAAAAAVYRRMTQTEFLTYLDGTRCGGSGEMDSSRLLNVAMGAFVGLDKIRDTAVTPTVGFRGIMPNHESKLAPLNPEHLIAYGLIPELVGRFSRITSLEPLDHTSLRRILHEAEGNVLARRKDFFALHGVRLEVTDDAIDEWIVKALDQGTGARALRHVVDQILRSVEHRLPEMAGSGVDALVIDRDVVMGRSLPVEHMGEPKDLAKLHAVRRHAVYLKQDEVTQELDDDDICVFYTLLHYIFGIFISLNLIFLFDEIMYDYIISA